MISQSQFLQLHTYYTSFNTIVAMLPYVKNREIAFIPAKYDTKNKPIRACQAHKHQSLAFLGSYLQYSKKQKPYNWYVSVAHFNTPPPKQSLAWDNRHNRLLAIREWEQNFPDKIDYYNFIIDIDSPDHSEISMKACVDSTRAIRDYLIKEQLKFYIVFSGMGFHIYINDENQDRENYDGYKLPNIYQRHMSYAEHLKSEFSELVDTKIYDTRRVIKLPYSVAIYEDVMYFCRPLHSEFELDYFKLENYIFDLDTCNYDKPYIYNLIRKDNANSETNNAG